jgi:hypothetical protein
LLGLWAESRCSELLYVVMSSVRRFTECGIGAADAIEIGTGSSARIILLADEVTCPRMLHCLFSTRARTHYR